MKFNHDGDPINKFTKHIEVITTSMGATLTRMRQIRNEYSQTKWMDVSPELPEENQKIIMENEMKPSNEQVRDREEMNEFGASMIQLAEQALLRVRKIEHSVQQTLDKL